MTINWGSNWWNKLLSVVLAIAVLGALGMLGYMAATPRGETFTEFYILGPEGEAADYPKELVVGEEGKVIIGIINNEYQDLYYYVEIWSAEALIGELESVLLLHEQKWEGEVSFVPEMVGGDQKVEFLLYKEGQIEVSQSLHLWVDVTQ